MSRRHEEKVDAEELARLEDEGGQGDSNIRVKMPDKRINEMFALAKQILGGRRVTVLCEDGEERMARIPGKMRRRQWVRENDLIIVWPWDFQPTKADVKHRYTKTQAMYLSRKGLLNEVVDDFGMDVRVDEEGEDDLFASSVMLDDDFEDEEKSFEETSDDDDMFTSEDDDDDMFATEDDRDVVESAPPESVEAEPFVVKEEYIEDEEFTENDDDDDDEVDALFG